ncbi:hypothetical protein IWX87_000005 [Polaromonas sp. CG_9.7]|nr:hypothetical protein [Polaromonas sp. CG_9.7]MBG6112263.1 hypothetical protein [Polaromonas sp. CG_9.2]
MKNNDIHSQVLLVWYAIAALVIAIVGLKYKDFLGPDTDLYTATLSIVLLIISMLITARDYRGRAISMRTNHIALKLLYDELNIGNITPQEKPKIYSKLLSECENHSSYDDRYFRIFSPTSRIPSYYEKIVEFIEISIRWLCIFILYFLPILIVILNFHKIKF